MERTFHSSDGILISKVTSSVPTSTVTAGHATLLNVDFIRIVVLEAHYYKWGGQTAAPLLWFSLIQHILMLRTGNFCMESLNSSWCQTILS